MITPNYDDQIKKVLTEIRDKHFHEDNSFPELSRSDLMDLLNDCEYQGYLSYKSQKKKLISPDMDEGFSLHPSAFVTRDGRNFIEKGDESIIMPTHQVNIKNVYGSSFGDNNSVTNYFSNITIEDLKPLVESIEDPTDKKEGTELIKTLETEDIKPGFLNRFDKLVGKYPKIAELVSKIIISTVFGN
ncbi:hypothetical protein CV787_02540 [Listeria monocytogenes]|nr:hypothetical protein [Listeria monocytogenes]EAF2501863.1 hypothetical protein [Listeria monocytogenes]EAF2529236.1 hypothetical protein [Listeria monocytogenes]EAF2541510.1 hypothetical protein [Listeria monocytogenes]EAF2554391.1 hypothetical protein [Listeria monocytogenes]